MSLMYLPMNLQGHRQTLLHAVSVVHLPASHIPQHSDPQLVPVACDPQPTRAALLVPVVV
jgi:hypothetical protein